MYPLPYTDYGWGIALGSVLGFVAAVWFGVKRTGAAWAPDGRAVAAILIALLMLVAAVSVAIVTREHISAAASGAIRIPSSQQSVTDGIYTGTLNGAALEFSDAYQETTLGLALVDLDQRTPELKATITSSNGKTLTCTMTRSHLAWDGDSMLEEVPCDGIWGLDQIRRATGLTIESAR